MGFLYTMGFKKTAYASPLGVQSRGSWKRTASARTASYFMDNGIPVSIEETLGAVADVYRISRDPMDYIYVPLHASASNRYNENRDAWSTEEMLKFRPELGMRVYATYINKGSFINHRADVPEHSRGVILDAHYNNYNLASDGVKRAVYEATGQEPEYDEFTEILLALDRTKDAALVDAYEAGAVDKVSMGCDCASTICNVCGNEAFNTFQLCACIRNKHAHRYYDVGGRQAQAFEWVKDAVFQEISSVDAPADPDALVQEGLLKLSRREFSSSDLGEIARFVAKNARNIPEPVAALLNRELQGTV